MAKSNNIFHRQISTKVVDVLNDRYDHGGTVKINGLGQRAGYQQGKIEIRAKEPEKLPAGTPHILLATDKTVLNTNGRAGDAFFQKFKRQDSGLRVIDIDYDRSIVGNEEGFVNANVANTFGRSVAEALRRREFQGLSTSVYTYPSVQKARFQVNGEFGSLRKGEIQMSCANLEQLDYIDSVLFQNGLGTKVLVRYGQFNQQPVNATPSYGEEFVIYDWSWNFVHNQLIEITLKMVGASNLCTAVDTNNQLDGIRTGKQFVYDWSFANNTRPVQSIIDAIDFDMQSALGIADGGDWTQWSFVGGLEGKHKTAFYFPIEAGSEVPQFDDDSTLGKTYEDQVKPLNISHNCSGFAVPYRMDNIPEFNETNKLNGATDGDAAEVYYSLGYIVHRLINYWLLEIGAGQKIADDIKKVKYCMRAIAKITDRQYLVSTDPLNILITNPKDFNYQCTFGKYYTTKKGHPEHASGESELTETSIESSGKDFRLQQTTAVGKASIGATSVIGSGAKTLTAGNLSTYSSIGECDGYMLAENILISRNFLRTLDPNKKVFDARFTKQQYESLKDDDRIDVSQFLNAIFKKIRQTTAGFLDLTMVEMSKHELFKNPAGKYDQIWIVNRNCDIAKGPTVSAYTFKLKTKDGNVVKQGLKMKVPKALAAEAFGRNSPGKVGGTNASVNQTSKDTADDEKDEKTTKIEALQRVREKLYESGFDSDSSSAALGAIKDLYKLAEKTKTRVKSEAIPYPLELSLTLQGTYGFKFGDLIAIDFMPARYKKSLGGLNIVFTVLEITHEIEPQGSWVTQLKTIARLTSNAKDDAPSAEELALEEQAIVDRERQLQARG